MSCDFSNCGSCQTPSTRARESGYVGTVFESLDLWIARISKLREMLLGLIQRTDTLMGAPPAATSATVIESSQVVTRFMSVCSITYRSENPEFSKSENTTLARRIPSFAKEGWLRHKEKWSRSLATQTGWLFQATDYRNRSEVVNKR